MDDLEKLIRKVWKEELERQQVEERERSIIEMCELWKEFNEYTSKPPTEEFRNRLLKIEEK